MFKLIINSIKCINNNKNKIQEDVPIITMWKMCVFHEECKADE